MTASSRRNRRKCRRGNAFTFSLVAIAVVSGLALAGWWMFGRGSGDEAPELITNVVSRGPYDFVVIEQGTVESAKNVELRCEVRSRGGGGGESSRGSSGMGGGSVSIIDVIPEGTMVQPGEQQLDIGPKTIALFEAKVDQFLKDHSAKGDQPSVVFHSGVFGMADEARFQAGTRAFFAQLKRLEAAGYKVYVNDGAASIDDPSTLVPLAASRFAEGNFSSPRFDGALKGSAEAEDEEADAEEVKKLKEIEAAKLVILSGTIDKNKPENRQDLLDELEAMIAEDIITAKEGKDKLRMVISAGSIGLALKKADAQLARRDFCLGVCDNPAHKDFIPTDRIEQARRILEAGRKDPERILEKHDADNNKKLSVTEVESIDGALRLLLKGADADRDGFVTKDEIAEAVKGYQVEFVLPVDFVLADDRVVETLKMADLVLQLDSSALELEAETQQTKVNLQKAQVVQSENGLKAAEIAREEYLKGTFVSAEKEILSQLFFAQQTLKTAHANLEAARNLMAKGIATALQVEAAQFGVDDAGKKYEVQQTRLKTLQDYTKDKELTKFDSDIDTARQRVELENNSLEVEEKKLKDIKKQIGYCKIYPPSPGQVVYANQYDSFRGSSQAEFIVTPGAMVRERQVLIRLPNADDMQVRATVNEARVTLVKPGLPVSIRVDALKDAVIEGEVIRVNQYADPGGYSSGNIKRYATFVKILNAPDGLRVGMNAEVRIHVERKQEALQVPVQALAEAKGRFFSLVRNGDGWKRVEVKISSTNDKVATIEDGLKDGDEVVMNPRGAGDLLVLSDIPDPTPTMIAKDIQRAQTGPITLAATTPGVPSPPGAEKGPGGGGAGGKGKKGFGGGMNPAQMADSTLQESDSDKDGKLSVAEIANVEGFRRRMLDSADADGDGFVTKAEIMSAASAQRTRGKGGGGGGGRGGEGGPPGAGPAGGGE